MSSEDDNGLLSRLWQRTMANASQHPERGSKHTDHHVNASGDDVDGDDREGGKCRVRVKKGKVHHRQLLRRFEMTLFDEALVSEDEVRALVFHYGVPEKAGYRALVWRLLLDYLPWDRSAWAKSLKSHRELYSEFVNDLTANPYAKLSESEMESRRQDAPVGPDDDPLGQSHTNEWSQYFMDSEIRHEIDKDVRRTYATFAFFVHPVNPEHFSQYARTHPSVLFDPDDESCGDGSGPGLFAADSGMFCLPHGDDFDGGQAAISHPGDAATSVSKSSTSAAEALSDLLGTDSADGDDGAGDGDNESARRSNAIALFRKSHDADLFGRQSGTPDSKCDLWGDSESSLHRKTPSVFNDDNATDMAVSASDKPAIVACTGGSASVDEPVVSEDCKNESEAERAASNAGSSGSDAVRNNGSVTPLQCGGSAQQDSTPGQLPEGPELDEVLRPDTLPKHKHSDILLRILFIYAKLNPCVLYVQGMNEILAPIYFVFAKDPNVEWSMHAEADAFFCFSKVMEEIRDRFIKSLDNTSSGIIAAVKEVNGLLKQCDEPLWRHLEDEQIDPRFYSFRWVTLLLSQEFPLPDVLRLWDSLFADKNRFSFLNFMCVAMLRCIRERLLKSDFAACMRMIQSFPECPIDQVLNQAHWLHSQVAPDALVRRPDAPITMITM